MIDLFKQFFSFDKLMKDRLVASFFFLGLVVVVMTFLGTIVAAFGVMRHQLFQGLGLLIWAFFQIIFLFVGLRLACELMVAIFSIDNNLAPDGGKSNTADLDPLEALEAAREAATKAAKEASVVTKSVAEKTKTKWNERNDDKDDDFDGGFEDTAPVSPKPTPKKPAAKKSAPKKTVTKKPSTKKTVAKKTPAKKTAAKKTTTKKAPAKKPTPKK